MKYLAFFIVFLTILVSCEPDKKEEILDLSEILPESKEDRKDTVAGSNVKDTMAAYFDLKLAAQNALDFNKILPFEEAMFPDRFNPDNKTKMTLHSEEGSVFFSQWVFKDSIKTMNAFYNWIDCFGEKCKSRKLGDELNFQRENMLIFLNDTSITYLSSELKLDEKKWQAYFLAKNKIDSWDLVLKQVSRAKAKWLMYADEEFVNYEKN